MAGCGGILLLLLSSTLQATVTVAQSNYDQVENSIDFPSPDRGLPESTVLDGKVTKLDELSPVIFLNRTKAALNCAAGYMQVSVDRITYVKDNSLNIIIPMYFIITIF